MTSLFANVYLDENVNVVVQSMLRSLGFEAVTARDADNLGLSDEEQLEYAISRRMTMVTHNRVDFEHLHLRCLNQGRKHWGIVIAADRPPREVTSRLARLLDRLTVDEIAGHLLHV